MACRSCRTHLRLLAREKSLTQSILPTTVAIQAPRAAFGATQVARKYLHATAPRRESGVAQTLKKVIPTAAVDTYTIYTATHNIFNVCASQATYDIHPSDRKADKVETTDDGEEIGTGGGLWHDEFGLLPTFSTWAQVTMLHMYLVVVRLRCLDREQFQMWQKQLVDHFFYDAEEKMRVLHVVTSHSTRQTYLKDVFLQWRGLMLAYDEGLVKGDAVLAAAVWRNLFKGREDVDFRHLAAVVSWMRRTLKDLDALSDEGLGHAAQVFKRDPKAELPLVDQPSQLMGGALDKGTVLPSGSGGAAGKGSTPGPALV